MNSMQDMKPEMYGVNDKNFPGVDKLKVGDTVELTVKVKVVSKTERVKSGNMDGMMGDMGGCSVGLEVNSISMANEKRVKDLPVGDFNNVKSQVERNSY